MRKLLIGLATALALLSPAKAADSTVAALTAASALGGTELLYCVQGGADRKCTPAQQAAYTYGLTSGDATISGVGAVTFATVNANVGSFGSATQCATITVNAKGLITAAGVVTCTPALGSITGLGTGVATFLATPSSANLLAALTTKTGTGNAVFGTAPTIDSLNATTALTLAFLTGGGTQCVQVSNTGVVSGTGAACGGSGSTGANPTATAGPTANNGVAATFMRSDASPAVQQGSSSQKGIVQVDNTTIVANSGVISFAGITAETRTGANTPIVAADINKLLLLSNAGAQAPTLPIASTTGAGWATNVCNTGAGVQAITPTTSTINGAANFPIPGGTAAFPICGSIQSDGTTYTFTPWFTIDASKLSTGTIPNARLGFGANVFTAAANALSSAGGLTTTVGSGTAALGTSAISSGACASVVTVATANVATTDVISFTPNADITAVTGYAPVTTGGLAIYPYPTSGNVNFKVCNPTSSSITPSAVTLNFRVTR